MLYDMIKDGISVALKKLKDDPESREALFNAQMALLDVQAEITSLRSENEELKSMKEREEKVVKYNYKSFLTFSDDEQKIEYCVICWEDSRKEIPVMLTYSLQGGTNGAKCPACKTVTYH